PGPRISGDLEMPRGGSKAATYLAWLSGAEAGRKKRDGGVQREGERGGRRMRRADRNGMTSSGKRAWRVQGMLASGSSLSHSSHRLEAGIAEEGGLQLGPAVVCTRLRTWWC
ncbi:unnamed protein product, partial [Prorocentrum cordatum]